MPTAWSAWPRYAKHLDKMGKLFLTHTRTHTHTHSHLGLQLIQSLMFDTAAFVYTHYNLLASGIRMIVIICLMTLLALQAHIQSGRGELRKGLKTVLALLHTAKLPVTRRIRALLVEGSLLEGDLQANLLLMRCCLRLYPQSREQYVNIQQT